DTIPKPVVWGRAANPANPANANPTVREVEAAARAMSLQVEIFKASTIREIQAAFEHIGRERPDALFVGNDAFFLTRRIQLATLAALVGSILGWADRKGEPVTVPTRGSWLAEGCTAADAI